MRRLILRNFLLLEVVLSTGIIALASAALFAPYHIAYRSLQDQERQLHTRRISELASIQLHMPEYFSLYLPKWEQSSRQALKKQNWDWQWDGRLKEDGDLQGLSCSLKLTCHSQTPKREREGYPVWRRFIEARWQMVWPNGQRQESEHYFGIIRSGPVKE